MFITLLSQIIFLIVVSVIIGIVVFIKLLLDKYKKFILDNSVSIKKLRGINEQYKFKEVYYEYFTEFIDNETYYNKVSARDLLIYELARKKQSVKDNIRATRYNSNLYCLYTKDVKAITSFGEFDKKEIPRIKYLLCKMEKKLFNNLLKSPRMNYSIKVSVNLTNINGQRKDSKQSEFDANYIEYIISKLEDKTNGRYSDRQIWNSICDIERSKVSNRIRFAIYKRDGYRCRKCGRKTNDLEIDHILPISKGGKTCIDNLQTLCRSCNSAKSDFIEAGTVSLNPKNGTCPMCGAPLRIVNGKYGRFYGCMNYPKCKYTKNV